MVSIGASVPRGTLRGFSESAMPSQLTITRYTYPLDPDTGEVLRDRYGDPYPPEETRTQTKCRLRDLSGGEEIIAGRLTATASGTLVCPQGTSLSSDMDVEVDGIGYRVVFVKTKSEALSAHTEALISKA